MLILARVDKLQVREVLLHLGFNLFPVNCEIFTFLDSGGVANNERVIEVFFNEDDTAELISLVLLGSSRLSATLFLGFGVTFLLLELGESFVASATNFLAFNL